MPSRRRRRKLIGRGYCPRRPARRTAPVYRFFTTRSRVCNAWSVSAACDACAPWRPTRRARHPSGVALRGRARDPARGGTGARERARADAVGARVRAARRRWPRASGAIITREELYAHRVGRRAASRRPLGRRVREQAAQQARGGAAGPALHPHPPRVRIPLPTPAFTKCSHRGAAPTEKTVASGTRASAAVRGCTPGGTRVMAVGLQQSSDNPARGDPVIKNKLGALAGCAVLALGPRRMRKLQFLDSSTQPSLSGPSATISGAGSTFAAPVYEQWASVAVGPDRQLPGRRLGRGHHLAREPRPSTSAPATRR